MTWSCSPVGAGACSLGVAVTAALLATCLAYPPHHTAPAADTDLMDSKARLGSSLQEMEFALRVLTWRLHEMVRTGRVVLDEEDDDTASGPALLGPQTHRSLGSAQQTAASGSQQRHMSKRDPHNHGESFLKTSKPMISPRTICIWKVCPPSPMETDEVWRSLSRKRTDDNKSADTWWGK